MSYGEGSFGEAAFGESPGGAFPSIVGVVGSMGAIETPDIFAASGTSVPAAAMAVADPPILVLVVELELGQIV